MNDSDQASDHNNSPCLDTGNQEVIDLKGQDSSNQLNTTDIQNPNYKFNSESSNEESYSNLASSPSTLQRDEEFVPLITGEAKEGPIENNSQNLPPPEEPKNSKCCLLL